MISSPKAFSPCGLIELNVWQDCVSAQAKQSICALSHLLSKGGCGYVFMLVCALKTREHFIYICVCK